MKIVLLQTGKTTEKHIVEGVNIYSARIKKYSGFEIITIPDIKNTRNMPHREQKILEGEKIMKHLDKDDHIVLLDERGKDFRSAEFALWLRNRSLIHGRTVFIIGGPWGFSDAIREKAGMVLSLSKMTFPHQLVRLLFVEQLYRAFTIIKGEPYHHE
jgi:23S rRNA (pseudouridine1915-N3)-methyltransferase